MRLAVALITLSAYFAGVSSTAYSHGVQKFTEKNSPARWSLTGFDVPLTENFGVTLGGAGVKRATCSPVVKDLANNWVPCQGSLSTKFKYDTSTKAIYLHTNLTGNPSTGLLYTIMEGYYVYKGTENIVEVPVLTSEGFYSNPKKGSS
ncbi:hypothetical protein O181_089977 [Austropuccinia psidii MF-1]|uniref:Uncharacterized protein n=1 Tax=Austropuccinia psidii MF-1 TaxID=1389203 RepID=A0A9Q3IUM7_9BASI|nr:hypothetical protein [Austropuccinia psidii MF-1]